FRCGWLRWRRWADDPGDRARRPPGQPDFRLCRRWLLGTRGLVELPAPRPAPSAPPSPIITADALQAAFVSVAERVRPAVVHVGTVQVAKGPRPELGPGPSPDPFFKDFFDQFFGRNPGAPRGEFRQPGLG